MGKYLVGSRDEKLFEKQFRVVNAGHEKEAIHIFALNYGRFDPNFLDAMCSAGFGYGDSFAANFWDIQSYDYHHLSPEDVTKAVERFEANVRKYFASRTDWAGLYIAKCAVARERGDWKIEANFPAEMLAVCWLGEYGKDFTAFDLAEIEADETPLQLFY